jgi:hypothetical protein
VIEQPRRPGGDAVWRPESERVRLARAARQTALAVRGVSAADAGPAKLFFTEAGDGTRLDGVTCIAVSSDGYEVSLRLVAGLVPLKPLGERVQAAVLRVAHIAGIDVVRVSVLFVDVTEGVV